MKELEIEAAHALQTLLEQVPAIEIEEIKHEASGPDILAHIKVSGRQHTLVCEVKSSGQPRHVRMALFQLQNYASHIEADVLPILIASYLSPDARSICQEYQVGFLDLQGNARIAFDGIFIERIVPDKPPVERRNLKSIFRPKAAQILRTMLRDPDREWRVADLAEAADVSFGHVSNVRRALLDREWAEEHSEGVVLSDPNALLDAWRDIYTSPSGERLNFYTTLHGSTFDEVARHSLRPGPTDGKAIFASFSAARWLAPYGRIGTHFFYADRHGLLRLEDKLQLSSISRGENVVVTVLQDQGLFGDCIEAAPGIFCTGEVQTYLDLLVSGERGREAADHLRQERLKWFQ